MSDNKKYTGKKDRIKVDSMDPSEVERLHKKYPMLPHPEIRRAIKMAGPMREEIVRYLSMKCNKK